MPEQKGERLCPICDSPLQPGSKKCGFCGTDLGLFESETEPAEAIEEPAEGLAKEPVEAPAEEPAEAEGEAPVKEEATPATAEPKMDSKVEEVFFGAADSARPEEAETAGETPAAEVPVSSEPEPEAEPVAEVEQAPVSEPVEEAPQEPAGEAREEPVEAGEHFECPQCGTKVPATANTCTGCGAIFAEEAAEVFQCPACDTLVSIDAKTCHGCGAIFVDSDEAPKAEPKPSAAEAGPEPRVEREPEAEIEPQVATVPEETAVAGLHAEAAPEEEVPDKKGLFSGLFGKRKRKGKEPEPESVLEGREPSTMRPSERAEVEQPVQTFAGAKREPPAAAPRGSTKEKSKGKELARLTAEIQPLMHLAISRGVEVSESRKLVDAGAVSVRARQLDSALGSVAEARRLLTLRLQEDIEQLKSDLNQEVKVAKELGGDVSRTKVYLEELRKADASSDFEAVYIYADKVKNELMPITGRYNESKEKISALKGLLADSELVSANTSDTRLMLTEAVKSFEANEFDKVDATIKEATKKLHQEIDPRMEDEIRRARNQLVELKAKGMNITPMITVLKSARTLMLSKDYAQALKELREFKEHIRKAE
ncbi:MAG: zinc ribbon domain-containing protein [Methanobacteriota archaeon]|nr:MAG: zinc ribbon domain-containing protein [Euryarchaeota archaeon]